MAISSDQKIDYLFKKVGFGVAKTDTNDKKLAANESIASPLLLRGDKVWKQSANIPAVIPSTSSDVVTVYKGATTVETTEDITSSADRTWLTGQTDWIPPEFGSTYLVNVYLHTSGDPANAESQGTKLFITGSGNNDEWFFDYQAGLLNFIGNNLPNGQNFTGNSIYITGAQYSGEFGVGAGTGEDANIGNLSITDTTIGTISSGANIVLQPTNSGIVVIDTDTGLVLPTGNTSTRPSPVDEGTIRYNSETNVVEYYDGSLWKEVGETAGNVTSQTITGDDSTVTFTLDQDTTDAGIIVSTNGVVQLPGTAYSVTGNQITFAEAPISSDTVDVRFTNKVTTVKSISNNSGNATAEVKDNQIFDISTTQSLQLPVYTVTEANSLANVSNGQMIFTSNGNAGDPCLAVYIDGSWKKILTLSGNIASS